MHTSEEEIGRIYIPVINNVLFVSTVALVLGFQTSTRLAAAYGVAVTGTMVITTILAFLVMRRLWNWSLPRAAARGRAPPRDGRRVPRLEPGQGGRWRLGSPADRRRRRRAHDHVAHRAAAPPGRACASRR